MPENQALATDTAAPEGANPSRGPLLTPDLAARLIKRSPDRIRQLSRAGWIPRQGSLMSPRYHLLDVVHGYIDFRDDSDRQVNKRAGSNRVTDARAREIELRNAQREGRLIELEEAIAAVEEIIGLLRSLLSGLPARATRDLQLRRTIESAVNDILDKIADLAAERALALAARRTASTTVTPDTAGPVGGGEPDVSADGGNPGAA